MDNNFSDSAKEIISLSGKIALDIGNDYLGPEHMVLAILQKKDVWISEIFNRLNITAPVIDNIYVLIEDGLKKDLRKENKDGVTLTTQVEKVIRLSVLQAKQLNDSLVYPMHLLLSILHINNLKVRQILMENDITYEEVAEILKHQQASSELVDEYIGHPENPAALLAEIINLEKSLFAIKIEKMDIVKSQKYEEAAAIRDKEMTLKELVAGKKQDWVLLYNKSLSVNSLYQQIHLLNTEKQLAFTQEKRELAQQFHTLLFSLEYDLFKSNETAANFNISAETKKKNTPGGYDIFLSKKDTDILLAQPLYDFLTSKGLNVFLSEESLKRTGNSNFMEEIDKALDEAKHLIILCSKPEFFHSPYVKAEWTTFLNEKRAGRKSGNIICLISSSINVNEVPISIRSFEVIRIENNYLERVHNYVKRK